ncbi:hypothetical protein ACHAQA_006904 [Verticillium albo-atrum]
MAYNYSSQLPLPIAADMRLSDDEIRTIRGRGGMKSHEVTAENKALMPKVGVLVEYQISCANAYNSLLARQAAMLDAATPSESAKQGMISVPNRFRAQIPIPDPEDKRKVCQAIGCRSAIVNYGGLLYVHYFGFSPLILNEQQVNEAYSEHVTQHSSDISHMSRYFVCPLPEPLQYKDHIEKPCGYSRLCHEFKKSQDNPVVRYPKLRPDELATHLRNSHKLTVQQAIEIVRKMEHNSEWAAAIIREYH